MQTKTIDPKNITTAELHGILLTAVAPRPIALASTISDDGVVNLSPFSFFNVFSANPPVLIFSPARRVKDNTTKHTLENAIATREVVIQVVNFAIVEQMSLSSTEYADGVNEFEKAGFTQVASRTVKPPRVGEAPVAFECKVSEVKSLGDEGGAGNLIFCEVSRIHIQTQYLDANDKLDTTKLDLVARMGGSWYSRATPESLFEIPKPIATKGIGVDALPLHIRNSEVLTGNNLGRLGNNEEIPTKEAVSAYLEKHPGLQQMIAKEDYHGWHVYIQKLLENQDTEAALLATFIS
ncbi:MAG: flavin reductase family protein [Flavobacteriaceae bacterium]|nr:flavin reductase family protein [Flavobacteriaceae bacterium]